MWPMPSVPRPRSLVPGRLVPGRRARSDASLEPDAEYGSAIVDCAMYRDGARLPGPLSWRDAMDEVERTGDGFVWIGLHEPSDAQFEGIAERFGLHPLAVEDAVHAHQRPKLEQYDNLLFTIVKTVHYDDTMPAGAAEVVATGEVMVFLGPNFVVTVRHGSHGHLSDIRRQLEADPDLLCLGPSVVLHAILDHVVDKYVSVAEALQDDLDEIETAVFAEGNTQAESSVIYALKREVVALRRATAPLLVPLRILSGRPLELIAPEVRNYFRDVNDHLSEVVDQVGSFDELLTTLVSANLAQVSVVQNEDMRKISAWVAIAAVPTMLAGIYGMNFKHMPELSWTFGYPLVIAVMLACCTGLFVAFKRNGWL
jgi:magnesium transporter